MKNNQLLAGAFASIAAVVLMACSKTETIDAGTPPAVAPAAAPVDAPAAPVAEPAAGAVKPDEFRAFSTAPAEPQKGSGTPPPGSLQAESAAFQSDAKKVEKKVVGVPPELLKGPGTATPPIVLQSPEDL